MVQRDFKEWFSQFRETIYDYSYYTDFIKVEENVKSIKAPLNAMNSLLGSNDFEHEFKNLVGEYPAVLKCIPILIAVRSNEITIMEGHDDVAYDFYTPNQSIEEYIKFMKKTGLYDLIVQHKISNLFDYVTGVEVGLDSNARKNRGGHAMENLVETELKGIGTKYWKEMYLSDVENQFNLDLSTISNAGKTRKRFDFVVESKNHIYGIEVNFYASNGSKLNETARSYKMIAEESKNLERFTFVWITDGLGWYSARANLEETFDVLDTLYCLEDLYSGKLRALLQERYVNGLNII